MSNGSMQLEEFQELLDRKGPATDAWPAADRERADRLLQTSQQARAILDEALSLREAMRSAAISAPASLRDSVIRAAREPCSPPLIDGIEDWLHPTFSASPRSGYSALFLLGCLVIGIMFGFMEAATAPTVRLEFTAIPAALDPRAL